MSKKKKSKDASVKSFQYSVELSGLLLVLIGLIGFGFGPVGVVIKKFALFLVGEWWPLILVTVLFLGCYMIAKRKLPKFFTSRLVGFYILLIVVLILSHFTFLKECESAKTIFKVTLDQYMERIASISASSGIWASGQTSITIGGGVIGAAFATLFGSLFGYIGTIIVVAILAVFGIVMMFNISLTDIFNKIKSIFSRIKEREKSSDDSDDEDEEDEEEYTTPKITLPHHDDIVITSVEELKNKPALEKAQSNEAVNNVSSDSYQLPSIDLLDNPKNKGKVNSTEFIKSNKVILERVLSDFGIKGNVVEIHVGPTVTQYEVSVPAGTKLSGILNINKEIALGLSAKDVRIEAPIPGKNTVGIEIPNPVISEVKIKEVLTTVPKEKQNSKIMAALGKDIMGRTQVADISKMPHLLVAGSTGSGKSVCINSFIATILMKYRPDEVKLVLVDPKKVELSNYNGVPHLLYPVVTDPKKASVALQRIVAKMEDRYNLFSDKGVKNIATYNEWVSEQNKKHPDNKIAKMDYIVVIIDELADLMVVARKEVEDSIMRITQMARAAGIHLIVATQRPSTDVITGVIKANIPSRIAFAVASQIDSRTILDHPGAEKLLGKGDMLYLPMGENTPTRIQGCFISDDEIRRVIEYVSKEQVAHPEVFEDNMTGSGSTSSEKEEYDDPQYQEIVSFAVQTGKISASLIQRRFRFGYNRAARIIDLLEERGIVGPQNGSKPREVLLKPDSKDDE